MVLLSIFWQGWFFVNESKDGARFVITAHQDFSKQVFYQLVSKVLLYTTSVFW